MDVPVENEFQFRSKKASWGSYFLHKLNKNAHPPLYLTEIRLLRPSPEKAPEIMLDCKFLNYPNAKPSKINKAIALSVNFYKYSLGSLY